MNTPLEALYVYATERGDLTHWLPNQDIVDTYCRSAELADKLETQLSHRLGAEDTTVFRKFADNLREASQLESEMLFYQGLAMGLQLGVLVTQV